MSFDANGLKRENFVLGLDISTQIKATDKEIPSSSMDTHENVEKDITGNDKDLTLNDMKCQLPIGYKICLPEQPQQTTHISDLPPEMFLYILRFMIGDDMDDCKMLDVCASVCRGWYFYARDKSLYREACSRFWTLNEKDLDEYGGSWRQMYIERPYVFTRGCYVATYTNPKPYTSRYIYLKFYIGGRVKRVATNVEPSIMLRFLKRLHMPSCTTPFGRYTITKDKLVLSFHTNHDLRARDGCPTSPHCPDCFLEIYEIPGHSSKHYCKVSAIRSICPNGESVSKPINLPLFKHML